MSQSQTLKDIPNAIYSPGSGDGQKLSDLRDGQQIALFGQEAAHANHSLVQEKEREKKTQDTCGPNSIGLLESANLTLSLGNRLKEQLEWVGSMEYSQTWKLKITPAGLQYWAHIASTRRISDKDCTGWPTPNTNNIKGAYQDDNKNIARMKSGRQVNLQDVARLAGWGTPRVTQNGNIGSPKRAINNKSRLEDQVYLSGQTQSLSPAGTESKGGLVLNPNHSRWLMGYREEWDYCGATAMQSFQKLRRNS